MKGKHPKITLLGSNSGNNLGDAAILASIMDILSKEIHDAEFIVPTTKPSFVKKSYGHLYNVKAVDIMPWTLSIRFLGLPTFYHIAKSDVALICDGIIFGKKLFNPLFNFLITLIFIAPWAKLTGCHLVCYSCGIGPFPTYWGRLFAKWVMNSCSLVILRENDSKRLAEEIGVTQPIQVTGDAAFLNQVDPDEVGTHILAEHVIDPERPILGINVTKYIDSWLGKYEQINDKASFLDVLSEGIQLAKEKLNIDFQPVLFSTHPMDEEFAGKLSNKIEGIVIDNTRYSSHEIQSVMKQCHLLIGMRFHSLVLASAVGVPIIGLIYAPKVRGYMRLLNCEELGLELALLNPESFASTIEVAWNSRDKLYDSQSEVVNQLKAGAKQAAVTVREQFFSM